MRLQPLHVSEYSTRGGISGNNSRLTRPSFSNVFRVEVKTLGDRSGMALPMALNRVDSFSSSTHSINIAHLLEKREMILRTGQVSTQVYFFRFSFSSNLLILNFSYLPVSVLLIGNFLYH